MIPVRAHSLWVGLCPEKLVNKTTTLHVHYPLLPVFVRLRHEVAYFYVLRRTSTSDDEILFVCLKLDMVPRNSISEGFAYMWQSNWVAIIAMKTETRQIHFLNRIGRHEVLLPINHNFNKICNIIGYVLNQNTRNSKFCFASSEKKKSHLSARVMAHTVQLLRRDAYCPIKLSN